MASIVSNSVTRFSMFVVEVVFGAFYIRDSTITPLGALPLHFTVLSNCLNPQGFLGNMLIQSSSSISQSPLILTCYINPTPAKDSSTDSAFLDLYPNNILRKGCPKAPNHFQKHVRSLC